jgi:homoserine dehydrogenase
MATRIGLIGFGTVGQAVARLLLRDHRRTLRLARVCVRAGGRHPHPPPWLDPRVGWTDRFDELLGSDVDVLAELVGGLVPARDWIERALLAGKSVVTANKQLVAESGPELLALAAREGRQLLFEGAVGGGVPIIRAIREGLAGDRLVRIAGILSGTCNYILTRMERGGLSFGDALAEAQARGYAEPDPTADVEGFDARAKLAILCAVGFGIRVNPADIPCTTIAGTRTGDFARARAAHRAIRQVSWVERAADGCAGVRAGVGPALVALDTPFARAGGCENVIVVSGELGGDTTFSGQGAGGNPTAVAVVSDILAIAGGRLARRPPLDHRSFAPIHPHPAALAAAPFVDLHPQKGPQHHA